MLLQILAVVGSECATDLLASYKRGIADNGVKAASAHDFGKFEGPV